MNDAIVPELAWQMGRPIRYGRRDRRLRGARPLHDRDRAGGAGAATAAGEGRLPPLHRREPLGVVLVIAPWNYPYLTAVNTIVPALLAGNAVHPQARRADAAGRRALRRGVRRRPGLPKGLFQNLVLAHAATERLIGSGTIDHVNFTGSVEGGRAIERAAAGTFASSASSSAARTRPMSGRRRTSTMPSRISSTAPSSIPASAAAASSASMSHAKVYRRFVDGFVDAHEGVRRRQSARSGDDARPDGARQASPTMSASHIDEAVRKGAKPHDRHEGRGRPARLALPRAGGALDVDHQMAVMREETLRAGRRHHEGARRRGGGHADERQPLRADRLDLDRRHRRAAEIGDRLETGTVFMNRCDYLDPGLAWTGVKDTGRGVSLSKFGYESLTRPKSFHLRTIAG